MIDFIKNNPDKIWTFLTTMGATIIGAVTSYIATTRSEKRKEKRELQREKLKDVLIPYCAALEVAIESLNKLDSNTDLDDLQQLIEEPIQYLKAGKRIYLSRSQRDNLQQYISIASVFIEEWYREEKQFRRDYCSWISKQAEDFYLYTGLNIYVDMTERGNSNGYLFNILDKKAPAFVKQQITGIRFVQNDDPENYRATDINLGEDIWSLFGAIEYGLETAEDQEEDTVLSLQLVEFLSQIDDSQIVEQLIDSTNIKEKRDTLLNIAKRNRDDLFNYIDKISG